MTSVSSYSADDAGFSYSYNVTSLGPASIAVLILGYLVLLVAVAAGRSHLAPAAAGSHPAEAAGIRRAAEAAGNHPAEAAGSHPAAPAECIPSERLPEAGGTHPAVAAECTPSAYWRPAECRPSVGPS
ncbi:hypothetical protein A5630_06030 [Mycolicibacterium mucogenicum]|uniref:Uncharacterized protein n=1 Tax=Mycolicibacterium mucogenicum TaxID=56689 RepID=A0A1A3GNB8_MYCMU|nr:hypothetical protein A5630_06030 [Mycolicibacterium mucogenicum]